MSVFHASFFSKCLMVTTSVNIILPDLPLMAEPGGFYRSGKRYKILWLFHGSCGDENSWLLNTNIARYATERDLMVVCPSVLNSDYANYSTFADGFAVWDYLFTELMPMVYGWLPASEKKEDNYIAGLSMGGNGALMAALGHPEKFKAVAVLSSTAREVEYLRQFATLTADEFRRKVEKNPELFPGPNGEGMRQKEINAVAKYPTVGAYLASCENAWDRFAEVAKEGTMPELTVYCGTDDKNVYPRFLRFKQYAKELGVKGRFIEVPGYGHAWALWDMAIAQCLEDWKIEKR